MDKKFLLYIDILGFSDLVKNDPKLIEEIFIYLDKLNFLQRHSSMKSIIFSDTILFFNKTDIPLDHPYLIPLIGDMIELCQILMYYFIPKNIFFKAVISYDKFKYEKLNNYEYYFGTALINSYNNEKLMPLVGVIIDKDISAYNHYFKSVYLNDKFKYILLTNSITRSIHDLGDEKMLTIEQGTSQAGYINREILYFRNIYNLMNSSSEVDIRSKHSFTWNLYKSYYKNIMDDFVRFNFNLELIYTHIDIKEELKDFQYFD